MHTCHSNGNNYITFSLIVSGTSSFFFVSLLLLAFCCLDCNEIFSYFDIYAEIESVLICVNRPICTLIFLFILILLYFLSIFCIFFLLPFHILLLLLLFSSLAENFKYFFINASVHAKFFFFLLDKMRMCVFLLPCAK